MLVRSLTQLEDHYDSLKEVWLGGSGNTGVGIKRLVESQKHLRSITMYGHAQPPQDAVAWARGEGVSVSVAPIVEDWDYHVRSSRRRLE
jgi:hypothetical protein